jgi:large repetitive protein
MKTKKLHILKWFMMLLLLAGSLGVVAQGPYPNTGDQAVCLNSTHPYGVIDNPTSSYVWSISNPAAGTITSTGHNTITVQWLLVGTWVLQVVETTSTGCVGTIVSINITVNDLPVVNPMTAAVCSGTAIGVILPSTSTNALPLTSYDITAVVDPALTGTATTGTGITNVNAIAGDIFTNTTTGPLTVVYTVVPYAGTCAGAPFTITVTINPAPVVNPMTAAVCSGTAIGVILPATSANGLALTAYDITAVVDPALTGTATTGTGITAVNAIAGDIFTNTTTGPLTVVYTVIPYAGTCVGASFTITVTINPAPVVTPMTATVCSGTAIGVVLPSTSTNGLALTAYDITAVVDPALTGTATIGTGITNVNAIAGDIFTNTTAGPLTVVYTVVPYAGTCVGASFTITVTITSAPVVNPMTAAVCSGTAIGVVLPATSANGLTLTAYDITAVVDPALTGTATTGTGITAVNAIAGDIFTNTTTGPLTVVYTVTPYAGTCVGAPFTITVTINPAPVVSPMTASVCSGLPIGVVLPTTSTNGLALTTYDITAVVDPGLTGTATTGTGITNINVIAGDTFTNPTTGALDVVYTVTPYAGTCVGAPFTITVTIYPAVATSPIYHD